MTTKVLQHEGGEMDGTVCSNPEKAKDETNVNARKEVKIGYKSGSIFGGVLTMIAYLVLAQQSIKRVMDVYTYRKHTFR